MTTASTVVLGLALGVAIALLQAADEPPVPPRKPLAWQIDSTSGAVASTAPGVESGDWRVIDHISAHHVALIHVEANRPDDARRIADLLVEPLEPDSYSEILVYVYRAGESDGLPARRVQWSPRTGYVETVYDESVQPASPAAER